MVKQVKSLKEIKTLGKSLSDLADEIVEGRSDAVAGILKMAHAYDEGMRRFSNAEQFFKTDPRTRWLSKNTRDMLRMVANHDLDPRVVLIPEPTLCNFIKEIPFKQQEKLLDQNPYVTVIDGSGSPQDVSYTDITAKQTKIAYDQENQRFRTPAEQRNFVANQRKEQKKIEAEWRPYRIVGNTVKFEKCEIGRNELATILRSMKFTVEER